MLKVSPTEYCFFNCFESALYYRDGPFIKNVSFVETRKNVIYSKLVNNPFNYPFVLDLVGVVDADEHALDRSDSSGTLPK